MPNIGYLPPGSEDVESPLGPAGQPGGAGDSGGAGGGTGPGGGTPVPVGKPPGFKIPGGIGGVHFYDLTTVTNISSPSNPPFYFADNPAYGIKGDGVTNDAPALAALIQSIVGGTPSQPGTGGGIIIFGAKTYLLATTVNIPLNISLWGCSTRAGGTGTQTPGSLNQTIFLCTRTDNNSTISDFGGCVIQDISFVTSGGQNGNYPVYAPSGNGALATTFRRCSFTVASGTPALQNFFQIPDTSLLHFEDCMFWDPSTSNQLYNIRGGGGGGFLNFTNCLIGITPTGISKPFQFEGALDATNYNLRFTNCIINVSNLYPPKGYAQFNYNNRTNSGIRVQFIGSKIILNGTSSGVSQYQISTTPFQGDAVVTFLGCDVYGNGQNIPFVNNLGNATARGAVVAFGNNFFGFAPNIDPIKTNAGWGRGNNGLTGTDITVSASTSPSSIPNPFNSADALVYLTSGIPSSVTINSWASGTSYPANITGPWYLPATGSMTFTFTGSITLHFVAI